MSVNNPPPLMKGLSMALAQFLEDAEVVIVK